MRIIQLLGAILLLIATPAVAKGGDSDAWIVTQRTGQVQVIRSGLQPASVRVRAALAPGDLIATGANGRAMLTRGGDYIVVAPGSRLQLPKERQPRGFTRLMQQLGTMFYKVRHTGGPHFAVDTPMLAAVVKGTSFTVVVDKDRSAVQVTEGVVEVSSLTGNARRLVHGGVTVVVSRDRPDEIVEVQPGATGSPSSAGSDGVLIQGSGDIPLSSITGLTGGLVREGPVAPVLASTNTPAAAPGEAAAPAETTQDDSDPAAADPAGDVAEADESPVAEPATETADTTAPESSDPVTETVETTVPEVTEPVVETVETTVPEVTEPVVETVETTVPEVTEPVVETVETTVPEVTEPVVETVDTTVPEVTEPVVEMVDTTVPEVTEPVVDAVDTSVSTAPVAPTGL